MAEDTKVDGEDQVNEVVPTPKFTEPSRDSATSGVDTGAIARQVAEMLRPDFEKMVQSTKDKRIAKLEAAVGGLAELEEMGVQIPENVKLEMRLRNIESNSAPKPVSQGSGKVEANDWSKIIDDVGLDVKQPEVIEFLRGEYRNLDHFEAEANRLKRRLDKAPSPTIETAPTLSGRSGSSGDLQTQFDNEVKGLHGNALIEKKMEFRRKGLDIN